MPQTFKEFCADAYARAYAAEGDRLMQMAIASSRSGVVGDVRLNEIETASQKEAIKQTTIQCIRSFPNIEVSAIWRAIYEIHVHRKSGIDNADTIARVISADQSWKKSSGHAFEEMIKILGTAALKDDGIEIILQRDLHTLISTGGINNEPRDISWLKEQIAASVFDLYAVVHHEGKTYCFGCIQSKTSIRDRVTRDREPSMQAMQSFFWSTVVVLDGDFLKNPKFVGMVNGGTTEHVHNGWHGMYVFSDLYAQGRIYPLDIDFTIFKKHAIKASTAWLSQRQWFNSEWMATEE